MKIILFFLALFLANLLFAQQKLSVDSFFNINLSSHEKDSLNKLPTTLINYKNDSSNQTMFFMRAQTYVLLGMHHKAVKVYNMLLKLDSLNPVFYYIRALCKSKHGFILDACKDLFKASALGLEQAKDVYNKRCPLYFNEIEKK